ncbi:hypothetical protein DVH05_024764 [Phytophthora capsici]|nr:hypothetical protein DVH05_024764 [Phytophthora capsici]
MNYGMPPARICGVKGRKETAKVKDFSKHSSRMTAVLTVLADKKTTNSLLCGKVGGTIEAKQARKLPYGYFYTVQEVG